MATVSNKSLIFRRISTGLIQPGVDMDFEDRPISLTPPPKGLVTKTLNIGLEPHMRDRMRGPDVPSYVPGYVINEPMASSVVAKVIQSDNEEFPVGQLIAGNLPIAEYAVIPVELINYKPMASPLFWKIDNKYNLDLNYYVGPLGLAGMTAWNSFYGLVKPKKGETIWVNAASSSVGELVVQLAKREGMRVIASVSSAEKLKYVIEELGADAGFNYKEENVSDALKRLAPDGLDVVYENVGGDHFQAAIENMKWFGRIIVCGMISQYNKTPDEAYGVTNTPEIFRKRILIQGFIYWDHNIFPQNIGSFHENLPKWLSEGSIKSKFTKFEGFDNVQEAFVALFTGKTFGKSCLTVADP